MGAPHARLEVFATLPSERDSVLYRRPVTAGLSHFGILELEFEVSPWSEVIARGDRL